MDAGAYTPMLGAALLLLSGGVAAECPNTPTRIAEVLSLAEQLSVSDRGAASLACIDAALAAHLGSGSERARVQLLSASWLETLGRYPEARARLRAAQALLPPGDSGHDRTAITAALGWLDYRLGELESAESRLAAAAASASALTYLERASVLDHLAVVERERSEYALTEQNLADALELAQRDSGPSGRRMQAQILNDRGGLRTYQGNFRAAVSDFEGALALYHRLGMDQTLEAAKTLNNLGNTYRQLGNTEAARTDLERALERKTALLGPRNPSTAGTINNLGMVAEQARDYLGAEAYYARALAIYEEALGASHANVATVAAQYGRVQLASGKYPDALRLLRRAQAIRDARFGPYSNWSAETLVDLVPVYAKLGQRERARHGAERAVSIAVVANEQELLYDCYMSYARRLAAERRLGAAIFFAKRAINVIQQMRETDVPPTKREQRSFLAQREPMYRDLADWLIQQARLTEAEQVLDLLKMEELADFAELSGAAAEPRGRIGMVRGEIAAAAMLDDAIHDLEVQTAAARGTEQPVQAMHARFAVRLNDLVSALSEKPRGARSGNPAVGAASSATASPASHVAVVRYLVLSDHVRVLARTSGGVIERSVDISRADLNRQVLGLHQHLRSRTNVTESQALFKLLIAPIKPALSAEDIHQLVLVPDDILRYVPFAALHDGEHYLVEFYALSLATPAAAATAGPDSRPLRAAAAFGVSRTPDGTMILPNVPIELHRVVQSSPADRYGALPGVILLDRGFTRASAARVLATGYPVVHIASHFVFRPGALADSYLLLGDGTHLTLDVIKGAALPLRGVEMLTLSACDTAIGDLTADGRELESFAALAQQQGVRSVLAALWAVPDLSTSILMAKFYGRLADGRDSPDARAEALREAQLLLLRGPVAASADGGAPRSPYADPFFWSAFTLLGVST